MVWWSLGKSVFLTSLRQREGHCEIQGIKAVLVGKNVMKQVRPDPVDSGARKEAFCALRHVLVDDAVFPISVRVSPG